MWMCALKPVNTDKKKQQHEQLNSLSLLNKHCLKWIQFVSHGLAGFIFLWNPIYTLLLCEINFQVHLMSHFAVIYTAFSAIGSSLFVYFVLLVTFTLSFVIRLVVFFMVTPHITLLACCAHSPVICRIISLEYVATLRLIVVFGCRFWFFLLWSPHQFNAL